MKQKTKKIIALINIFLILLACTQNVFAVTVNDNVKLYNKGECDYTLQANDGRGFYPLTCTYVEYIDEIGVAHPAYCVNRGIDGIGEYYSYDVNLSELIQDERLWRVAVNGFPNKTASELGVANDFDAFFATKQAVYAILGNFNLDTHYRAVNERGEKIIASIRKLVNEGLYGTATYKNPSVNVSKNGNIVTETISGTKYLVQSYSVTSAFSLRSYQVNLQNAPSGTKIFDGNGVETSKCATNKFKTAIPYSSLKSDINCTIQINNAEVKSYPVFYGKTSIAGTQNYMVTATAFESAETHTTLDFKTNNAKIEIIKKDDETGKVIPDTTFALYNSDGKQVATATTDNNGIAKFIDLYPGAYTIKEIKSNKDYVLNNNEEKVTVQYGETAKIEFTNQKKTGKIKVIKVDKDNNEIKIKGVEFEILDKDNKIIQTLTTDESGEATSKNLRIGQEYKVREKSTKSEYILSNEIKTVTLKENEIKNLTFENELKKGQIRIVKVDKDNNEIALESVTFEILDESGKLVETLKTDSKGEATSAKLPINKKYTIMETKTQEKYVLDKEIRIVTLKQDKITDVIFENELKKGKIEIYKTDSEDNKIKLKGVEFEVINESGEVVEKIVTDENGYATTSELPIGKYNIKEVKTDEMHILNEEIMQVEVKQNVTQKLNVTNDRIVVKKLPKTGM